MGQGKTTQMSHDQWFQYGNNNMKNNQEQHQLWMIKEGHEDHGEIFDNSHSSSPSVSSSIGEATTSNGSCSSSLDTTDDASSSPSSCSPNSDGALYDLSSLMAQLPIKRGRLSKFYQGKSQSFTSLSRVASLEDLAKKETPYNRRMKACKSYGAGLDSYKSYTLPKPTILKKSSRSSFSATCTTGKASFINRSRPPLIPVPRTCCILITKATGFLEVSCPVLIPKCVCRDIILAFNSNFDTLDNVLFC